MADKSGQIEQPDYDKLLQKQDFFPKIFLMPSEIRLHKDHGLMVVKRNENHPDKYEEEEVLPITVDQKQIRNFDQNPDKARHPAGHGLLSLFKRTSKRRIKLAICVCVYSQPKHMLKSTIKGIQESYRYFLDNAGIMPHEIILTVIFDGIEKVNNSKDQTQNVISYFNEIDLKNGFRHKQYGKTLQQYLKQLEERNFNFSVLNQQKMDNVSVFTEDELNSLKSKLFENQYNEYMRIKELNKEIQKLKKLKDIKVDSLPRDVHKKYQELSLNFCVENNMWYETQEEIQEYLSSKKNIRIKLIYQALHQTEMLCKRYIDSRLDKAILYPVRMEQDDLRNPRIDLNESQTNINEKDINKPYNYMFFCVKHKNEGKLSSHMLFFEGFCKLFDPEYCILTDVGVKPKQDAIYKMWAHMQKNPRCGGVCGYMGLQLENPSDQLGYRDDGYEPEEMSCLTSCLDSFFTVQRAQQFQYHFAHMLDKPFQAFFGYIHVLPGAFSGYRWRALKSVTYKQEEQKYNQGSQSQRYTSENSMSSEEEQEETLMKRYLKTALSEKINISLQDSNMYLAEDRIMCLGIHALGYTLDYLPDAESQVDPVTSLTRLLGQRRRWINGSWFAFNYVHQHAYQSSSCMFYFQLLYYMFVKMMTWVQTSVFYVAMNLTLISAVQSFVVPAISDFFQTSQDYQLYNYRLSIFNIRNVINSIPDVINFLYICLIMGNLLYSILVNNNNSRFKKLYYISSTLLGVYGLIVVTLLVVNTAHIIMQMYRGQGTEDFIIPLVYLRALIIFVIIGHGLPILWTFSFKKYVQMITSVLSYIYYSPTYINLMQLFAFCRIDDLSWGTKGLDNDGGDGIQRQWQRRKYIFVLQYLSTNVITSYVLIKLSSFDYPRNVIILASTCLVAFMLGFRLIFAVIYLIKYYAKRPWKVFSSTYINQNRANGNRILNALNMIELKIKEIQKEKTKKNKEQQYKKLANATSQLLSKTLSNFGNKLRSKVAHHMVSNNIIPKKQLIDPKKKLKNRRKVNLKKNLNPVEQLSNQESEQSKNIAKMTTMKAQRQRPKSKEKEEKDDGYDIVIPETTKKNDLRARIQAIKQKRNKTGRKQ